MHPHCTHAHAFTPAHNHPQPPGANRGGRKEEHMQPAEMTDSQMLLSAVNRNERFDRLTFHRTELCACGSPSLHSSLESYVMLRAPQNGPV